MSFDKLNLFFTKKHPPRHPSTLHFSKTPFAMVGKIGIPKHVINMRLTQFPIV